jgi:putative tricarboxylic transport membrane protein
VGVICFILRRNGYPVAPFVLGIVLGDIVDKSLRRGLVLSDGDLTPFFARPIAGVLAAVAILIVLAQVPAVRRLLARKT